MQLDHMIIHTKSEKKSHEMMKNIFGFKQEILFKYPVIRVNEHLRLLFDEEGTFRDKQHLAFLVSEEEFDFVHQKLKASSYPFGRGPNALDRQISYSYGGRGLYFVCPDNHIW